MSRIKKEVSTPKVSLLSLRSVILLGALLLFAESCCFFRCHTKECEVPPPTPAMGPAPYALCSPSWQCDDMITAYSSLPAVHIAFIINTFAPIDNCPCFDKLVTSLGQKLASVEFIMLDQVCIRDHRCGSYEFLYGETMQSINEKLVDGDATFRDRYLAYSQQVESYYVSKLPAQTRCLINPLLEANQTNAAGSVIIGYSQQVFGNRCEYIWDPEKGTGIAGYLLELHGASPVFQGGSGTVYNNDGTPLDSAQAVANLKKYTSGTYASGIAHYWTKQDNCLPASGPYIDPRLRTQCATAAELNSIVGIIKQAQ